MFAAKNASCSLRGHVLERCQPTTTSRTRRPQEEHCWAKSQPHQTFSLRETPLNDAQCATGVWSVVFSVTEKVRVRCDVKTYDQVLYFHRRRPPISQERRQKNTWIPSHIHSSHQGATKEREKRKERRGGRWRVQHWSVQGGGARGNAAGSAVAATAGDLCKDGVAAASAPKNCH